MSNAPEEHEEREELDQLEAARYALPLWIWGTTAFIAGYMMLQLQCFA